MTQPTHLTPPSPSPVMQELLHRIARAARPPLWSLSAQQARAAYEAASGVLDIAPPPLAEVMEPEPPQVSWRLFGLSQAAIVVT